MAVLAIAGTAQAEDHVMAATKSMPAREVPASLSLSLEEAQDYAVNANRSLRNAEIAVQQAYAQRWQTIAAMLPQADLSWGYQHLRDSAFNPYKLDFGPMQMTMRLFVVWAAASFTMRYACERLMGCCRSVFLQKR